MLVTSAALKVHGDDAYQRHEFTVYHHPATVRKGSRQAIRIARRKNRDARRLLRAKAGVIANPDSSGNFLDGHDPRPKAERRR